MNRYIIGILAVIGLGIILFILLFSSHNTTPPAKPVKLLPSYANTNAQVKMIVDGPIVAAQNHNSVVVTVSQYTATFDLIQGYDGNVIASKIFNNSQNSFKAFLYALYYAGYSNGVSSSYPSDIGLCPAANRYDFYLTLNGETLQHYWFTNCGQKTYNGNFGLTLYLFNGQIPNIIQMVNGANISQS